MAEPKKLKMGVECCSPDMHEEESRVATLQATVEHYLPAFSKGVAAAIESSEEENAIVLHQDAFASGYHDDEYTLLGMAIKYAGLYNIEIRIIGKNHETF